jgi:hypothetical protein
MRTKAKRQQDEARRDWKEDEQKKKQTNGMNKYRKVKKKEETK